MKKLIAVIVLLLMIFVPIGCKSVVAVKEEVVTARIEDKHRENSSVTFVNIGGVTNQIHHPARYYVVIEYEGRRYDFEDESVYSNYNVGDEIKVVKVVKEYNDGSFHTTIKLK